jgi:hypothetical protein
MDAVVSSGTYIRTLITDYCAAFWENWNDDFIGAEGN